MTGVRGPGQYGLDWHNFFVANVQTGFGPFIAVYLSTEAWTQGQIGTALSIGTIAGMASQLPGGALVDWLHNKRLAALAACIAICVSAAMLAIWPEWLPVLAAEVLHGFASAMLPAAIAAMSLALVGRAALGERVGRNARFAALGNGVAAAVMGAVGSYVSEVAVFYLTAALMLPGIAALFWIPQRRATLPTPAEKGHAGWRDAIRLLLGWRILVFAGVVTLFHLGNAAMLPLVAGEVTHSLGKQASLVIAACIVLPQLLVAYASPHVGHLADRWGRRPVILLTFLAVPIRGALLALFGGNQALPLIQLLDGVSAAGFGVMLPLIAADFTRGTERFTLCLGLFGLAAGLGATISTALAGGLADRYGNGTALWTLAAAGLGSVLLAGAALPETRPLELPVAP
ncbi:MAG: MFS transporter [Acetobacteraceae bacterium]|nr:MFS transporter [Acetobacteraceae bacterium]